VIARVADNRRVGLAALPLVIGVVVAPAQLKIESGAAPAAVTVTAPAATSLRLWCSTGTVSEPTVLADGRFGASYVPPAAGKPTYAVIAAWDEATGEAATATVTLAARTEIPVETEPGALVVAVVHGRRSTAHANAAGHARVPAWVWPGDHAATVTATDAAGNATTNEVALELPPPDGVFLLAPAEAAMGQGVRVYAFATGGVAPQLTASGAQLSSLALAPGVTTAMLTLRREEATLTATASGDREVRRIRAAAQPAPPEGSIPLQAPPVPKSSPPKPAATSTPPPAPLTPPSPRQPLATGTVAAPIAALSPWELGAVLAGRYSGPFLGGGLVVEARRRLRRFAVGLDLDGHDAAGSLDGDSSRAGGLALRLVGEARFAIAPRATLYVAVGAGGHWARVRREPPLGPVTNRNDGGPSLAGTAGLLARIGPGWVVVDLGYAWTPLLRTSSGANVDGVGLSVGYRVARWRRRAWRRCRGDGRRPRRRRRRAPGT
jgi:hypothetical protein